MVEGRVRSGDGRERNRGRWWIGGREGWWMGGVRWWKGERWEGEQVGDGMESRYKRIDKLSKNYWHTIKSPFQHPPGQPQP